MMKRRLLLLAGLAAPLARAEPDEQALGRAQGYPIGNALNWYQEPYRVGSWSAFHQVQGFRMREVAPANEPLPLPRLEAPRAITYRHAGQARSLADYLERQRATGLLVLKDGAIVAEHYRYGRGPEARFLSFSMAKSVTALLVGIALHRGVIASLDDPAEKYARGLGGTPYGGTALRHLLRMASGLAFTERYDGLDDIARMSGAFASSRAGTLEVLRTIAERHAPAGEVFRYASGETEVLGRVLTGATGRSLAALTQEWLWQPMGAEHAAWWRLGGDGQEGAYAYFVAALRDWGRLGLLLANDGRAGDRQVVPREYLLDATDPARQPPAFHPRRATPYFGYGYQFWLLPMAERSFALQGVHGQGLFVQPASGVVMVVTSVWEHASGRTDPAPGIERDALWRGVLTSLGGRTD